MSEFINKYKEKRKEKKEKKRKEKELEKELEKKLKEEEELEKELKEDRFGINDFLDVMKEDVDEEFKSLLSEDELKEYEKEKQEEIKETKKVLAILGIICIFFIGLFIVLNQISKPPILKVTLPIMEEYYINRYNQKLKIETIDEIKYIDEETKETVNSGIYLATTKDDRHIISVDNELLGDDISIGSLNNDLLEYIKERLEYSNIVDHSVDISYKPYYINFNRYTPHIKSLPYKKTLEDLLLEKNLTITYKIIYQGELDINDIFNLMSEVSEDSSFYLLKVEVGLPKKLTIISKDTFYEMQIQNNIEKDKGIVFYQLDSNINNITNIEITDISGSSIETKNNYIFTKGITIKPKKIKRKYVKKEDSNIYSDHILLRFDSNLISETGISQLDRKQEGYEELPLDRYEDLIFISSGGYTYLITKSNELKIGMKGQKKSFLCNIGIC